MKGNLLVPVVGAGAVLIWYGLNSSYAEKPKALSAVAVAPEDKRLIPNTSAGDGKDSTVSFSQLLTAYKQELRKWQSVRDAAFKQMQQIERQARQVCREFAWNATWSIKYDSLGLRSEVIWSKNQPRSLLTSCTNYVIGVTSSPGAPKIKPPPSKGGNWMDHSWERVAISIRQLQAQVKDAKALLPDLRKKYLAARADFDSAQNHVAEMEKKIADLHAREVY